MQFHPTHLTAVLFVVGAAVVGCGHRADSNTGPEQAVFVDTETMKAVVAPVASELPAMNPETGKRTLMSALYCPACRSWHPVPPPEQINRVPGAATCRRSGATLTSDGPWPE